MIVASLGANWKLRRALPGMDQGDRDLFADLICPDGSDVRTMGAVRVRIGNDPGLEGVAGAAIPMR